jgi:Mor family transcriptional regulator
MNKIAEQMRSEYKGGVSAYQLSVKYDVEITKVYEILKGGGK